MLDGIFRNPTTIFFGKDSTKLALNQIPSHGTRVLVITGESGLDRFGILQLIEQTFKSQGIFHLTLSGIKSNPHADPVYSGIAICREHKIDFILAVGGASVIDTAKSIAIGVPYEGDFFDFYLRKLVPKQVLPVGTILTISGAGSESSDGAVITKGNLKYSCGSHLMYPVFSALDPTYCLSVPQFLTACGVVDSISHVMERYFSTTQAVQTSTELCEGVMRSLIQNGSALVNDLENYDLRAEVMWASKIAHDNTVGFGRKHDWASHTIAHELGARYNKVHGALLAVVFPAWMTFMQRSHSHVFARFGKNVFGIEGPDQDELGKTAIEQYKKFLGHMGMPSSLFACLGSDVSSSFSDIAEACCSTTVSRTIGNFERLDKDNIIEILNISSEES